MEKGEVGIPKALRRQSSTSKLLLSFLRPRGSDPSLLLQSQGPVPASLPDPLTQGPDSVTMKVLPLI